MEAGAERSVVAGLMIEWWQGLRSSDGGRIDENKNAQWKTKVRTDDFDFSWCSGMM